MSEGLEKRGIRLVAENGDVFFATLRKGEKSIEDLTDASGKGAKRMTGFFDDISKGVKLGLGIGIANAAGSAARAMGDFFTGTIDDAAQFERQINRFSSITGGAMREAGMSTKNFSDLFLQMGADTQYSASQAADAAINLAKGGFKPAEIAAGALAETLNLAAAGELELAAAADIAAKQMGVWKDTGVGMTQVSDLLAQAANASTVDVQELALGLANVGGQAKTTGLSFEETVRTMALLAPGFSSASDAGTSFKTFLGALTPTTDPATKAMRDLGLFTDQAGSAFFDAQGDFIGMEKASQLLFEATKGLSEEQKSLQLRMIFGQDAFRAAAFLAEQGADGYNRMGKDMRAAGTAAEQAEKKNQGLQASLDAFKGSLETLSITVGTKLVPALTTAVKWLDKLIGGFIQMISVSDKINQVGDRALEVADSFEEYGEKVAFANAKITQFRTGNAFLYDVMGLGLETIKPLTKEQFNYAKSLTAAGVSSQEAEDRARALTGVADRLTSVMRITDQTSAQTSETLREQGNRLLEVAEKGSGYATLVERIITDFAQTGDVEAFNARIKALDGYSDAQASLAAATEQTTPSIRDMVTAINDGTVRITAIGKSSKVSAEQLDMISKVFDEIGEKGPDAFGAVLSSTTTFLTDYETAYQTHQQRRKEIQKTGTADQLKEEDALYAEGQKKRAIAYAQELVAQRQHLGQMLIEYTQAAALQYGVPQEKVAEMTGKIRTEYGIQASLTETTFGGMRSILDGWAANMGQNTDQAIADLGKTTEQAITLKQRQDELTGQYTVEVLSNFDPQTGSALELYNQLMAIPTQVETEVTGTFNAQTIISQIDAAQSSGRAGGVKVGAAISDGIAAGIAQRQAMVNAAAARAVAQTLAASQAAAGIRSPSRLFAAEVGEPMAMGIALGFQQGLPGIQDAISGGLNSVSGALSGQVQDMISRLQGQLASGLQGLASMGRLQDAWDGGGIGTGANPSEPRTGGYTGAPVGGGGTISPPPTAAQIASAGSSSSTTTISQTYSPTYTSAPPPPAQDWAAAQAVFGGA